MPSQSIPKEKAVLLACGSFNPPTILHLRMFEAARDFLQKEFGFNVVEGIISPVATQYDKETLIGADDRLKMCQLATESSSWIRADGWECQQNQWTPTLNVLQYHQRKALEKYGNCQLMLLCGTDLVSTFTEQKANGEPVWEMEDLKKILSDHGVIALQRGNDDVLNTLSKLRTPIVFFKKLLIVEDPAFQNRLSSTKLRDTRRQGKSIRYCTPDRVADYIEEKNLYKN